MSDQQKLAKQMKEDWDRRIKHDYRFWMSDGHKDDAAMWASGERDLAILMRDLDGTRFETILELGCGVGRILHAALPRFSRVIGVDVSAQAIEKAKQLLGSPPNLQLITGDGLSLNPIADGTIDLAISFAALASVPTDVFAQYLLELRRVLRPGGAARLQIYLGREQPVYREDTLHIRCYNEEKFREALKCAGFELEWIEELKLPIQVSSEDLGFRAMIVAARRGESAPRTDADGLSKLLLPEGEKPVNQDGGERDLEYWMTVNYAKDLVDRGETDRARETLEFAAAVSKTATIDVSDVLNRIVERLGEKPAGEAAPQSAAAVCGDQRDRWFALNIEIIRRRFPAAYAAIHEATESGAAVAEIRSSAEGPILYLSGQCLDHPDKPVGGAAAWLKRALHDPRFADNPPMVLAGFGAGYHIEELLEKNPPEVRVIEPDAGAMISALRARDLSRLLSRISALYVGTKVPDDLPERAELLLRPQCLALNGQFCTALRSSFYGTRGLRLLHPSIGVVGPMQGGTLPITAYVLRALGELKQRVREFDMAGFAGGYHQIERFMSDPMRRSLLQNSYVETLSQVVLESALEKPVDILICMAQAPLSGRTLLELRKRGVITVLWFLEDYLRFTYWKEYAQFYDFVFTIQRGECIEKIRAAGAGEVHYLPAGCDPFVHAPAELSSEERARWGSQLSFLGAGYHNRQMMFAGLADYNFKIWGTEWPECRPFDRLVQEKGRRLTPAEYIKIFNATEINLNLHSSTERDGVEPNGDFVNPRTFELASCGAFQLVDERTLLPEAFDCRNELVTFSSAADLKAKIEYYRERPEERRAIATRARERALREHTYVHRMREMLNVIYNSRFESLKRKQEEHPWSRLLKRSEAHSELHSRCQQAFKRGEEPILDGLVADIVTGSGKLSDTEKKLLFLFHVRKQIIRMRSEEQGKPAK